MTPAEQAEQERAADAMLTDHATWTSARRDGYGNALGTRAVEHTSTDETIRRVLARRGARSTP